jgi:hypothetical protein
MTMARLVLVLVLALHAPAFAQREMSTDRPDRTESPFTLERGRAQIELDAVAFTRDREPAGGFDGVAVAASNLKFGVSRDLDVQLLAQSWRRERVLAPGAATEVRAGFGDLTARVKLNLLGNDGGPLAAGVMPFVTLPAREPSGGRGLAGGVIVPASAGLPLGWTLGAMAEVDLERDASGNGARPVWVVSTTAAHDLAGPLAGYVEVWTARQAAAGALRTASLDTGLTFAATPDLQLDAGVNTGLSSATEDVTVFLGLSYRR